MTKATTRRNWLLAGVAAVAALAGVEFATRRFSTQEASPEALKQLWSTEFDTPNGEKLSKQSGAQALDTSEPLTALNRAAEVLGLPVHTGGVARALETWVGLWPFSGALYNPSP